LLFSMSIDPLVPASDPRSARHHLDQAGPWLTTRLHNLTKCMVGGGWSGTGQRPNRPWWRASERCYPRDRRVDKDVDRNTLRRPSAASRSDAPEGPAAVSWRVRGEAASRLEQGGTWATTHGGGNVDRGHGTGCRFAWWLLRKGSGGRREEAIEGRRRSRRPSSGRRQAVARWCRWSLSRL
jgi:hypothetical protein